MFLCCPSCEQGAQSGAGPTEGTDAMQLAGRAVSSPPPPDAAVPLGSQRYWVPMAGRCPSRWSLGAPAMNCSRLCGPLSSLGPGPYHYAFDAESRTTVCHLSDPSCVGGDAASCLHLLPSSPRKPGTAGPSTVPPATATRPPSLKLPRRPCRMPAARVLTRPTRAPVLRPGLPPSRRSRELFVKVPRARKVPGAVHSPGDKQRPSRGQREPREDGGTPDTCKNPAGANCPASPHVPARAPASPGRPRRAE